MVPGRIDTATMQQPGAGNNAPGCNGNRQLGSGQREGDAMKTMELGDILFREPTQDEALRNVANVVMELTTVTRQYNGRGRSRTYSGNIDAIADAARQLAEMVLDSLKEKEEPVDNTLYWYVFDNLYGIPKDWTLAVLAVDLRDARDFIEPVYRHGRMLSEVEVSGTGDIIPHNISKWLATVRAAKVAKRRQQQQATEGGSHAASIDDGGMARD